jgi:hypothetical protein
MMSIPYQSHSDYSRIAHLYNAIGTEEGHCYAVLAIVEQKLLSNHRPEAHSKSMCPGTPVVVCRRQFFHICGRICIHQHAVPMPPRITETYISISLRVVNLYVTAINLW